MSRNTKFLNRDTTRAWLGQFDSVDQETAVELISNMLLVSRDKFSERVRQLILDRAAAGETPLGLYAEREIRLHRGVPNRLFKESDTKRKRAYGTGPLPVQPTRAYDPKVGSEGIVAQLISELCREYPKLLIDHPGPDLIRKKKIRRFVIVTDFIGSGKRAETYLKAAWKVRSVRSWWSARNNRGTSFEVIAYAAVPEGKERVESHASSPEVHVVSACPTIFSVRGKELRQRLRSLCIKYDPGDKNVLNALGYKGSGALIAFAHGAPNNTPRILHQGSKLWAALFPKRVTASGRDTFSTDETDASEVRDRLEKLRQSRLAASEWLATTKAHARVRLTVLAALSHSPRTDEAISGKTGLTILDVRQALSVATSNGWIDGHRRITDRGHAELESARRTSIPKPALPSEPESLYYPKSLRAPSGVSS